VPQFTHYAKLAIYMG